MKRKSRKPKQKRNSRKQKKSVARSSRKRVPKRPRQRQRSIRLRRFLIPRTRKQSIAHQKSLAVLAAVRRGESFNKAAKREGIKPQTVLRYVTIITENGLVFERARLSRYDIALRRWRAAEDGAEQGLLTFKGQTVAGHILITDPDVLIRLEEAGQLDFDELYDPIDGDS